MTVPYRVPIVLKWYIQQAFQDTPIHVKKKEEDAAVDHKAAGKSSVAAEIVNELLAGGPVLDYTTS